MERHEFTDFNSLLQLISGQSETEFMNLEKTYGYERSHDKRYLFLMVYLGDKKFYHQRQVYDFMAFLGDAGGIYGSMMLIGTVIHFGFS